jgi:hypothetical protein
LRHNHQTLSIERVGNNTARQRTKNDGNAAKESDKAERKWRFSEQVDVPVDRNKLHLRTGHRHNQAQPKKPKIAVT